MAGSKVGPREIGVSCQGSDEETVVSDRGLVMQAVLDLIKAKYPELLAQLGCSGENLGRDYIDVLGDPEKVKVLVAGVRGMVRERALVIGEEGGPCGEGVGVVEKHAKILKDMREGRCTDAFLRMIGCDKSSVMALPAKLYDLLIGFYVSGATNERFGRFMIALKAVCRSENPIDRDDSHGLVEKLGIIRGAMDDPAKWQTSDLAVNYRSDPTWSAGMSSGGGGNYYNCAQLKAAYGRMQVGDMLPKFLDFLSKFGAFDNGANVDVLRAVTDSFLHGLQGGQFEDLPQRFGCEFENLSAEFPVLESVFKMKGGVNGDVLRFALKGIGAEKTYQKGYLARIYGMGHNAKWYEGDNGVGVGQFASQEALMLVSSYGVVDDGVVVRRVVGFCERNGVRDCNPGELVAVVDFICGKCRLVDSGEKWYPSLRNYNYFCDDKNVTGLLGLNIKNDVVDDSCSLGVCNLGFLASASGRADWDRFGKVEMSSCARADMFRASGRDIRKLITCLSLRLSAVAKVLDGEWRMIDSRYRNDGDVVIERMLFDTIKTPVEILAEHIKSVDEAGFDVGNAF